MESLMGTQYFSTIDLKSSFWQVKMSEESSQYTAFTVGSMGVYVFQNAIQVVQCSGNVSVPHAELPGGLNLQFDLIYLDDIIVYSRTQDNHLTHLQAVLDRFVQHGLKLKSSKCHFFKENITYLGHKISTKGMLPAQEGIEKIANMRLPSTVTGIRKLVGAVGYFRHFNKNFACITRPLDDLTSC